MSTANPFGPRRSRPARNAVILALLATVPFSACGGDDADSDQAAGSPDASAPAPSPSPSPASGDGDLVFYYDSDAPFFNGIVRIGEFDGEMDAIERHSQDFSITIERAQ